MARQPVERVIHEYVELLKQHNVRVEQAVLFGSHALGIADDDSDIDVAIISPDLRRNRFSEGVMLKLLTQYVDTSLSPRPYSPQEVEGSTKGAFLHDEIVCKGRVVYGE